MYEKDLLYFLAAAIPFLLLTVILNYFVGKYSVVKEGEKRPINHSASYPMVMTYLFLGFIPTYIASSFFAVNGYLVSGCVLGGFIACTLSTLLGFSLEKRRNALLLKQKQREKEEKEATVS